MKTRRNQTQLDAQGLQAREWEERFLNRFGNRRDMFVVADILAFISSLLKEQETRHCAELAAVLEQFMDSYCSHQKKNREACSDCGRMKLK